ncbi:MAG: class I SAM-dependent methyltransferase [Bryobacteraceae bacterium]
MSKHLVLVAVVAATLGLSVGAASQMSDDEVWKRFLLWLPAVPPKDSPKALLDDYDKKLRAAGSSQDEANSQRTVIMRLMKTRDDGWQIIFNNIYSSDRPGFRTQPNATLISSIAGRSPGRALDAGMGQGRNAVFLALKGWEVTGFDVSDAGLALARKNAGKAGVHITAVQKSERDFDYGVSQWDLILFSYVPFPIEDVKYVDRLYSAVRPGGLIVVESFASNINSPGRRPVDFDPVALRRAFHKFRIITLDDVIDTPDWMNEKARMVRMVAEKPSK